MVLPIFFYLYGKIEKIPLGGPLMNIPAHSIEELIAQSAHQELFHLIDQWMQVTFPTLRRRLVQTPTITFVAYGDLANANPDEPFSSIVALAPQKNNLSFYITGEKNGLPILANYATFFPKSAMGKTCLRLRNPKKLNLSILEAIVHDVITWNDLQQKAN